MRPRLLTLAFALPLLAAAVLLPACGDSDSAAKAAKASAKKARDAELLKLPYPQSTGALPASITITYDAPLDRTTMTLRLTGLRVSGRSSAQVSSATLHLTSSHKGPTRASNNPEGSVDGSLIVQTTSPGILAYSGSPGAAVINGQAHPLREASGKERYTSAKPPERREEVVRFRFPTEPLVAAVNAGPVTLTFGAVQLDLSGPQLADLREFTARLNPQP
jgi:hypothetical protein